MSTAPKLGIQITITLDDEELTHATAFSFESAEEEMGKMERFYLKEQAKAEDRTDESEEFIK